MLSSVFHKHAFHKHVIPANIQTNRHRKKKVKSNDVAAHAALSTPVYHSLVYERLWNHHFVSHRLIREPSLDSLLQLHIQSTDNQGQSSCGNNISTSLFILHSILHFSNPHSPLLSPLLHFLLHSILHPIPHAILQLFAVIVQKSQIP